MAKENQMKEIIDLIGINYSNLLKNLINQNPTKSHRDAMISIMKGKINAYVSNCADLADYELLSSQLVAEPLIALKQRIVEGFEEDVLNEQIIILCYHSYCKLMIKNPTDLGMDECIFESFGELAK